MTVVQSHSLRIVILEYRSLVAYSRAFRWPRNSARIDLNGEMAPLGQLKKKKGKPWQSFISSCSFWQLTRYGFSFGFSTLNDLYNCWTPVKLNHQSWRTITNKTPTRLILGVVNWTNICCEKFLKLSFFCAILKFEHFTPKWSWTWKWSWTLLPFTHSWAACAWHFLIHLSHIPSAIQTNQKSIPASSLSCCYYVYIVTEYPNNLTNILFRSSNFDVMPSL